MKIERGTCAGSGGCNASANTRFESPALANELKVPRIIFSLKRRNKKNVLQLPPVALGNKVKGVGSDGFELILDKYKFPKIMNLYLFRPAGRLLGVEKSGDLVDWSMQPVFLGDQLKVLEEISCQPNITRRERYDHTCFSLTIAKIAYCYAAAELGLDGFDGTEIRQLLKGERDDVYNFVGGMIEGRNLQMEFLHELYINVVDKSVSVIVHLFASCEMSPYEVFVGYISS